MGVQIRIVGRGCNRYPQKLFGLCLGKPRLPIAAGTSTIRRLRVRVDSRSQARFLGTNPAAAPGFDAAENHVGKVVGTLDCSR